MLGHVGRFGDQLVHTIAKDRKSAERRDGHDQTAHGGDQRLVDSLGQVAGSYALAYVFAQGVGYVVLFSAGAAALGLALIVDMVWGADASHN